MDETAQNLPGTQSQSRSSRRVLQRSNKSSSQQIPPQTPAKPTASPEEENPAPLSTPIQTPPSAKMSKTTTQTNAREEAPAEVDVEMQAKDTHDSIEVKIEFETQEDESFLFRARPRSRGTAANASVAINDEHHSSSPAPATPDTESESESDSEPADEAMDLDGETCFPDDTKATSPESSRAGENPKEDYTNSETPMVQDDEFEPTPMNYKHMPHSESMIGIVRTDIQRSGDYASSSIQPNDVTPAHESPALRASQQSPWKADVPAVAPVRQLQSIRENSQHSFLDPSYQSPWASSPVKMRQAAAEALAFNSFNSPMPASPSPLASSTSAYVPTPLAEPVIEQESVPPMETVRASTPEPILEIKRFANFMSPSPERPRRQPKRARVSGGHLPSTQNLLVATVDNPWDATPRPTKRVRWAPEVEGGAFPDDSDPATPLVNRTASPPPELAVADLPTGEDDQFQKHFQAVSRRTKITHRLLPSASQQVLESPGPMAMAEAFVTADALGAKAAAPEAHMVAHDVPRASQQPLQLVSQEVDDVDAVLENLNEFIDMCDVQADLERTKEEERQEREKREREKQDQQTNGITSSQLFGGFSSGGFLDAGVWE
ncbi:hypothetical protein K456DRAFT_1835557 [Colletotrichum gloeosporioides 23]|nr:hypothetical protein K456DRAFT_1835557 [Colletotrichum gloeosporioides 23]